MTKGRPGRTVLHLTCEHCGRPVDRLKGHERDHTFCSRECYWKSDYRSELARQRNYRSNPDAQQTRPCANCGTDVTRYVSSGQREFFCSVTCRWENRKKPHARKITTGGYVLIYVGKDVPGASKSGHMFEHRHVMQTVLGRPLLPEENVHHKNGVRTDNRPANLELWSRSQPRGQRVADKIAWAREFLALYERET